MLHSAESIFPPNLIEYLREFEYIWKTVLAHESGDPGVQFNEKTEGRKSRETVPLKNRTQKEKGGGRKGGLETNQTLLSLASKFFLLHHKMFNS
jgi:hypothetical protein